MSSVAEQMEEQPLQSQTAEEGFNVTPFRHDAMGWWLRVKDGTVEMAPQYKDGAEPRDGEYAPLYDAPDFTGTVAYAWRQVAKQLRSNIEGLMNPQTRHEYDQYGIGEGTWRAQQAEHQAVLARVRGWLDALAGWGVDVSGWRERLDYLAGFTADEHITSNLEMLSDDVRERYTAEARERNVGTVHSSGEGN